MSSEDERERAKAALRKSADQDLVKLKKLLEPRADKVVLSNLSLRGRAQD